MKTTNKKTIIIAAATLIVGVLAGWLIFGGSGSVMKNGNTSQEEGHEHVKTEINGETVWTCSMHPQVRQNEPGNCPICGMELIPLEDDQNEDIDPEAISMSPTAMKLANVSTAMVGKVHPVKQVRLDGKIEADERLIFSQASHIPGRIEKLMVNFTGEYVSKGEIIAYVYSPELVTAQEELFEAQKIAETQPQLFAAAKEKLKNWKLSDTQVEGILSSGKIKEEFPVQADISGYVTAKMINLGDYVREGKTIYEIADLSKVWVLFDVYESDIPWVKKGDIVEFSVASLPGKNFEGVISYVDPVINPKTRVAKARVEYNNEEGNLKPEMFASGVVEAKLTNTSKSLVVPKTAVMWTGKRSVVYIKTKSDQGVNFIMREITLGPALGDSYLVENGLMEGEEIAVNGTFSIDAAAQLAGKPSMMAPEGGPVSTGHNHGGMDMGTTGESEAFITQDLPSVPEADIEPIETDPQFTEQLTDVYEAYLDMKNAFVETNAEKVSEEAKDVIAALENVNMGLLKGDAHMAWMDQLGTLNSSIETIGNSKDIEKQRQAFAEFNLAFYKSLKMFGLNGTAYYQFCPMANDDQGAYWLSETEKIRNPYFGEMMMSCGEVKEVIK